MSNKVNFENTKLNVDNSKNLHIGNISNKKQTDLHGTPKDSVLGNVKKTGKLEKTIAIIFIIALVSLIVVLKSV